MEKNFFKTQNSLLWCFIIIQKYFTDTNNNYSAKPKHFLYSKLNRKVSYNNSLTFSRNWQTFEIKQKKYFAFQQITFQPLWNTICSCYRRQRNRTESGKLINNERLQSNHCTESWRPATERTRPMTVCHDVAHLEQSFEPKAQQKSFLLQLKKRQIQIALSSWLSDS